MVFQIGSEDESKEVFCAEFGNDDRYLAAGCGDGSICITNLMNGKLAQTISYLNQETNEMARAMSLKWRKTSNTIICAFSDGIINEYSNPVGKQLSSIVEEDNQTFVLDIDPFDEKFCTGGKDYTVRVYD